MYVVRISEPGLWTVGFYDPAGKWHPESDHASGEEAHNRAAYLNGRQEPVEADADGGGLATCANLREWYAGLAMQGLLGSGRVDGTALGLSARAFAIADGMIRQSTQPPPTS